MNKYRKAMFESYWFPVFLFYILPVIFLFTISFNSDSLIELLVWLLGFTGALFSIGAIVAPYFGPKILKQRSLAFLMALVCHIASLIIFIIVLNVFSKKSIFDTLGLLFPLFFIYGLLPAMFGGFLFIGSCERLEEI